MAGQTKWEVVETQDEQGNWKTKIQKMKRGMTEENKGRFLEELERHGRVSYAARAVGIWPPHIKLAREKDPNFDEACFVALQAYTDRVIGHHQDLVFNGTKRITYDRNGNISGEETVFPIRLIELELKKHDEGYRDKRVVDMKVSGGVLVAPAEVNSIEDWEQRFSEQVTIEGEAQEVIVEGED